MKNTLTTLLKPPKPPRQLAYSWSTVEASPHNFRLMEFSLVREIWRSRSILHTGVIANRKTAFPAKPGLSPVCATFIGRFWRTSQFGRTTINSAVLAVSEPRPCNRTKDRPRLTSRVQPKTITCKRRNDSTYSSLFLGLVKTAK